eukprot:4227232-Pleurochrysis_carterae.AAC.1
MRGLFVGRACEVLSGPGEDDAAVGAVGVQVSDEEERAAEQQRRGGGGDAVDKRVDRGRVQVEQQADGAA